MQIQSLCEFLADFQGRLRFDRLDWAHLRLRYGRRNVAQWETLSGRRWA